MAIQYTNLNAFVHNFIVPDMHDLLYQPSPVFARLHQRQRENFKGGILIQEPVIVGKLWAQAVGKGEEFNIDFVTTEAAIVESMKLYVCNVSLYGFDAIQNDGDESVFSQVEAKMQNAGLRVAEVLATDMYGNNLLDLRKVTGLPQWYDDGSNFPTIAGQTRNDIMTIGTVGGLNAYQVALGATFTLPAMNTAYTAACLGNEHPDLTVVTRNGWNLLWQAQQPFQRYASKETNALIGFETFKFNASDVALDPLLPTGTSGVCYMLNTAYLKWFFSTNRKFYFSFTGFKEGIKTIDVAGQFLVANQIMSVNPRTGAKIGSTLF